MPKLNYSTRRVSGARLGQLVARDLKKKEKSTVVNRDPHLDLNIDGRELGEEGLKIVSDALLSAIRCDAVKLDELHLSGCRLPIGALKYLAQIVSASTDTLQKLELTNNDWELTTPQALHEWEAFLNSFRNCAQLRRVNFSQNKLGDKGIETLVKVYAHELQNSIWDEDLEQEYSDETLSRSISGISPIISDDDDDDVSSVLETLPEHESSPSALAASAPIKSTRRRYDRKRLPSRGLPSIAYIHLEDVGMTDLSALHLISLLPYHQLPHILLGRLDAQLADMTEGREDEIYDKGRLNRGVMYQIDSPDFTSLGKKILENVEKLRRSGGLALPLSARLAPSAGNFGSPPPSPDSFRARRNSESSRAYFPETPSPSRKDSMSSIRTLASVHGRTGSYVAASAAKSDLAPTWADIVKTRTKLQGEILKSSGTIHVCQLWTAAIKLLSLARIFMLPQPHKMPSRADTTDPNEKSHNIAKPALPPSPVSPSYPRTTRSIGTDCVGGLDINRWTKILTPVADPEGVLSESQVMSVVDWASDRATLAKEGEWAGKLPHVQMWKLLDVHLSSLTSLMDRA